MNKNLEKLDLQLTKIVLFYSDILSWEKENIYKSLNTF